MSYLGFAPPDLCSIRTTDKQEELAEAARGGFSADGDPLGHDDAPASLTSGLDRAIRLSTAVAVLAVAGIAAYISYWHAYAVVRAHGGSGITARLEPATIDGLVYASSMVVLSAARHRVPVPSLARWLLGLGIAATLTANMAQGWSRGLVGAVVAAWPAVSLVGSYELWSGSSARPGWQNTRRRPGTSATPRPAALRRVLPRPQSPAPGSRAGSGAARQTRNGSPQPRPPCRRPSRPAGGVTRRYLRPTPSMTLRWRRTGSAPKPAIRFRNASWPRCSDAHPAAGRAPESPKHGEHRLQSSWRIRQSPLAPLTPSARPCCTSARARSIARSSFKTGWSQMRSCTACINFSCGITEKQLAMSVSTTHRRPRQHSSMSTCWASCAERPGRNPKLHGGKSASKTGSSTISPQPARSGREQEESRAGRCSVVPSLGMSTRRAGSGRYRPSLSSLASSSRSRVNPVLLDGSQSDLVDARRVIVPAHRDPRAPQNIAAADLVIQRVEPTSGIGLGRPVQRMLQGTGRIGRGHPRPDPFAAGPT